MNTADMVLFCQTKKQAHYVPGVLCGQLENLGLARADTESGETHFLCYEKGLYYVPNLLSS